MIYTVVEQRNNRWCVMSDVGYAIVGSMTFDNAIAWLTAHLSQAALRAQPQTQE